MKNEINRFTDSEIAAAREWMRLVDREDVAAELHEILESIDRAVTARGPTCWASGRCCRFDWYGHRLYANGLETARCWLMMRAAPREPARGALPILAAGPAECRYQVENLCTARKARPSGCRVYFCEKGTEDWQQDVYEEAIASMRTLHDRLGASYRFAEWRFMLDLMDAADAQ